MSASRTPQEELLDHLKTLGIEKLTADLTIRQVKKAYHELALLAHTDRFDQLGIELTSDQRDSCNKAFFKIKAACQWIEDHESILNEEKAKLKTSEVSSASSTVRAGVRQLDAQAFARFNQAKNVVQKMEEEKQKIKTKVAKRSISEVRSSYSVSTGQSLFDKSRVSSIEDMFVYPAQQESWAKAFNRIYYLLREDKTFATDFPKKHQNKKTDEYLVVVDQHAREKPNSRTAEAWTIVRFLGYEKVLQSDASQLSQLVKHARTQLEVKKASGMKK